MHRPLVLMIVLGCAPLVEPVPSSIDLARTGDREVCEAGAVIRAASEPAKDLPPPLPLGQRPPVTATLRTLATIRDGWHRAADCTFVSPPPNPGAHLLTMFKASDWLVAHAEDLAAQGDPGAALAQLEDVWDVATAIRFGGALPDMIGLAIQSHVAQTLTDHHDLLPAPKRARLAARLLERLDTAPSPALDMAMDDRSAEAIPWSQWLEWQSPACLLISWRLQDRAREVATLPVEARAQVWAEAFDDLLGRSCDQVGLQSSILADQASLYASLNTHRLDAPRLAAPR